MKIGIIIGSHRQESQSAKVGQYLNGMLSRLKPIIGPSTSARRPYLCGMRVFLPKVSIGR